MGIQEVFTGLANAVRAAEIIVGGAELTCYDYTPDSIVAPAFYAGEVEIEPNIDFSGDTDTLTVVTRVMCARTDDKAGQKALLALLARKGPTSVRAAILAAAGEPGEFALGGACDDINIISVRGMRGYTIGTTNYVGAEIRVLAIGAGSEE